MTPQEAAKRLRELAGELDCGYRRDAAACRLGARALGCAIPERWPLRWTKHGDGGSVWWTAPLPAGREQVVVGKWLTTQWRWWYESTEQCADVRKLKEYSRPWSARRAAERAVSKALRNDLNGKEKA